MPRSMAWRVMTGGRCLDVAFLDRARANRRSVSVGGASVSGPFPPSGAKARPRATVASGGTPEGTGASTNGKP